LTQFDEADLVAFPRSNDGLKWSAPKSNRLKIASGSITTRYVVHEQVEQMRAGREYIHRKPYLRIVARLAPVPSASQTKVPPFNPLALYATQTVNPGEDAESDAAERSDVKVDIIELLGGILPIEDGQELADAEVAQHVEQARGAEAEAELVRSGAEAETNRAAGETEEALGSEGAAGDGTNGGGEAGADQPAKAAALARLGVVGFV
jgi:hypothetical protein